MEVSSLTTVSGAPFFPVKLGFLYPKTGSLKHHKSHGISCSNLRQYGKRELSRTICTPSLHVDRKRQLKYSSRMYFASLVCSAALNARCGAEQTQTVEKPVSVISNAPVHGKEKSPQLDDGGSGFPPRDDGDGGGGGGGGGNWSGGFFFFGFLAFLGFLKEKENDGSYEDRRRDY